MLSLFMRFLHLFLFSVSFILISFASPVWAYKVVASIPPVASLVRAIAGEYGSVDILVDHSTSPHMYALKPSDLRKIGAADILFWIGPAYEAFLVKALENHAQKSVALMKAPHLQLYPLRFSDEHDHAGCHDCASISSSLPSSSSLSLDGHIWLDPDNGMQMAQEIAARLTILDPDHRQDYERRLQKLKERLEYVKMEIQATLQPYENQGFLVFHDGYQYFEKAFHLKAGQAMTLIPDVAPSAKRLSALKRLIQKRNVQCLFAESQFPSRLVKMLSEETKIKVGMLDPVGTPDLSYEDLLFSLMKSFSACLKEKS